MDSGDSALNAMMGQLREEFVASLVGRRQALDEAWTALNADAKDAQAAERLRFQVHKLAGSAAMYGFEPLAQAGRTFETRLLADHAAGKRPVLSDLAPLLEALQHRLDEAR